MNGTETVQTHLYHLRFQLCGQREVPAFLQGQLAAMEAHCQEKLSIVAKSAAEAARCFPFLICTKYIVKAVTLTAIVEAPESHTAAQSSVERHEIYVIMPICTLVIDSGIQNSLSKSPPKDFLNEHLSDCFTFRLTARLFMNITYYIDSQKST